MLESSDHAVRVCQAQVSNLPASGALDVGPNQNDRFDSGWHDAERNEHGIQNDYRWSARSSSLLWRMDEPAGVRFTLRLRAAHQDGATIRATLNGADVAACTLPKGSWTDCRIDAPALTTHAGLNELRLTSDTVAPADQRSPRELAFVMQHSRVRVGR